MGAPSRYRVPTAPPAGTRRPGTAYIPTAFASRPSHLRRCRRPRCARARAPPTRRATYYGSDAWSIHSGSCGYGQLAEDVGTGWDIAALNDKAHDYKGSCGKCKEVRCRSRDFQDGYGAWLDRKGMCWNEDASLVVMITDTCPVRRRPGQGRPTAAARPWRHRPPRARARGGCWPAGRSSARPRRAPPLLPSPPPLSCWLL
jgi:hypothetical protein